VKSEGEATVNAGTELAQAAVAGADRLPDPFAEVRRRRLTALARLDRSLAWIVSCGPVVGFAILVGMLAGGYVPGALEISLWLGMHVFALVGVEVGFHRLFSHRSFQTYTPIRVALAIMGSMAFQGPVIWWAATHRRHHRFSDRPGDPHSPHLEGAGLGFLMKGLFHAHLGWLFVAGSTRDFDGGRYAPDLYRDPSIFRVHVNYFGWLLLGFAIPTAIGGIATWSLRGACLGFLWGGLIRIFIMNHVFYWCINSVTHAFGSRPFDVGDQSTNNIWLCIPTLGQSWHNNHHAFPNSAVTQFKWWQIDLGGWFIRLLEAGHLAWDVRCPSREMVAAREVSRLDTAVGFDLDPRGG
jgi:stearoyl-CoA desaturase (delta-9 desaturase)